MGIMVLWLLAPMVTLVLFFYVTQYASPVVHPTPVIHKTIQSSANAEAILAYLKNLTLDTFYLDILATGSSFTATTKATNP